LKNKYARATLGRWKGTPRLNLRKYYEKDSTMYPTKQGVTLSLKEWQMLLEHKEEINKHLSSS